MGMMSGLQDAKLKGYIEKFNRNDEETQKQAVDNVHAYAFLKGNIPYFECPDPVLEETYYFRWWVYRKHIKQTPEGRFITEFHPEVPWAGPYNSINCAVGHHLAEGRWLRRPVGLMEEEIDFWLQGSGDIYSYSSWIPYGVYEYALVSGKKDWAAARLRQLCRYYREVEKRNMTPYGLFWSDDDRDAMEMSISGSGLRPTLNSYMYGNALAVSRIAGWAGEERLRQEYREKASALGRRMDRLLWDPEAAFYKVIPWKERADGVPELSFGRIPAEHNVREELGYIPWMFGIPDRTKSAAFDALRDPACFRAPYGPTTADRSHPLYGCPCSHHECLWNGPSWPFATTQTLNALIRAFQEEKADGAGTLFMELLERYAASHYRRKEDGALVNWLDENLDPDTGEWISRSILEKWGWRKEKGGYERGKDYNHSAFCDLVIRGIGGLVLGEEERLSIRPLLPLGYWDHYCLDGILFRGKTIGIYYDKTGERYGRAGYAVYADGRLLCASADQASCSVALEDE